MPAIFLQIIACINIFNWFQAKYVALFCTLLMIMYFWKSSKLSHVFLWEAAAAAVAEAEDEPVHGIG